MPGRTPEGDALTALVLPVFALNGELLEAAAVITAPHELTPARWQVLGAVLEEPLPVAEIARRVGLTRQSVQRVANDVVAQDWAQGAQRHSPHQQEPRNHAVFLRRDETGRGLCCRYGHDQTDSGQIRTTIPALSGAQDASGLKRLSVKGDDSVRTSLHALPYTRMRITPVQPLEVHLQRVPWTRIAHGSTIERCTPRQS